MGTELKKQMVRCGANFELPDFCASCCIYVNIEPPPSMVDFLRGQGYPHLFLALWRGSPYQHVESTDAERRCSKAVLNSTRDWELCCMLQMLQMTPIELDATAVRS